MEAEKRAEKMKQSQTFFMPVSKRTKGLKNIEAYIFFCLCARDLSRLDVHERRLFLI